MATTETNEIKTTKCGEGDKPSYHPRWFNDKNIWKIIKLHEVKPRIYPTPDDYRKSLQTKITNVKTTKAATPIPNLIRVPKVMVTPEVSRNVIERINPKVLEQLKVVRQF